MKTLKIIALLLILSVTAIAVKTSIELVNAPVKLKIEANINDDYKSLWEKADSLVNKGLTRSALDVVKVIYNKAISENNTGNLVKSVVYRLKLESYISDDDYVKEIGDLSTEISKAGFPAKAVLYSMLAETYWRYYQGNRYLFLNRTETVEFIPEDIRTWHLRKIVNEVIKNYRLSLQDAELLKKNSINVYDEILVKYPDSKYFRPTLYDFLIHRAIDFFSNEEPRLTTPANKFEISDDLYFRPYDQFITEKIQTQDTFSLPYYAALLFQDLLSFHKNDADPQSLIDNDLKRLRFVYAKSVSPNKDTLYISALENLQKRFTTYPSSSDVTYEIANYYYKKGLNYSTSKNETEQWLLKKSWDICNTAIKKFPEATGSLNCRHLQGMIEQKSISLTVEDGNSVNKAFRGLLNYRNLDRIYVRICPTDPEWNADISYNNYGEKLVKQYLKLKVLKTFSLQLKSIGDYQPHSVEILFPEIPAGFYTILVATDSTFSIQDQAVCYTHCWSTDMAYLKRTLKNGDAEFIVTHRETGYPLSGISAQVYRQFYNYTTRRYEYRTGALLTTDSDGKFTVPASGSDYYNFYVKLSNKSDHLNTSEYYQYKYYKDDKRMINQTYFFTDRSIYRPGQTVYFKGILLQTNGTETNIRPGASTTVTLYDVNYQKAGELQLTSNEYGTFNGSFVLPSGVLNGQMHLGDPWGNVYFSVEEYKRPKFEVAFDPVKGSYKLGEKVSVTGKAKSYSGTDIDNAQVKYRVVRTARFPWWWWYWYGYYPTSAQMEITNGVTTTNASGEFTIDFTAIPDLAVSKKSDPVFNYMVYADVTDINGETRSAQTNVNAGYKALEISVNFPSELEKAYDKPFVINTTNLNGQYEYAKGNIKIYCLKQPEHLFRNRLWPKPDLQLTDKENFYSLFPYDLYADENNSATWEKEKEVLNLNFNTAEDSLLNIKNLSTWKSGKYTAIITAIDKFGQEVKSYAYFTLYSNDDKTIPVNAFDWFSVIKSKGEPGEEAIFLIGTRDQDVKILKEIELNGSIINKEWITLNNEMKKITIPIKEEYRGNFSAHFTFIKKGRSYKHDVNIEVPYTNKMLDISFETFRNKLLPGQNEEWKIKIKGKQGEKVAAEMLAAMYDASLDAFKSHSWFMNLYNSNYMQRSWEAYGDFGTANSTVYSIGWNPYYPFYSKQYDYLNWFGFNYYNYNYRYSAYYYDDLDYAATEDEEVTITSGVTLQSKNTQQPAAGKKAEKEKDKADGLVNGNGQAGEDQGGLGGDNLNEDSGVGRGPANIDFGDVKIRTNFNETAFFYPTLLTDADGSIIISFTVPEALTKWKFMGFAHTKDLKYGFIQKECITQKDLMVMPNAPRFFREGDKIVFAAKVSSLAEDSLTAYVTLQLFNAETGASIDQICSNSDQVKCIGIPKGQSRPIEWELSIPEGIPAIKYKIIAKAGNYSDGEEMIIPVVTNRMLITETLPLPVRGIGDKTFILDKLYNAAKSNTLSNYKLTLEFTSNPAWYAIQALPYLMEYPYECTEQIFSRFYSNSISSFIANSHPKIKEVFESWKNETPDALLSNLEKNQDLKYVMLQETPWVLQAKNESQRKRNIAILFDTERMKKEIESALKKIEKRQTPNGGFTWFPGMPDDRYITQHIITGMGHLDKLGVRDVKEKNNIWQMTKKGIIYLDNRIREDYEWLLRYYPSTMHENHLGGLQIQYLYARTYFMKDVAIDKKNQVAFDYFKGQAKKYWLQNNRYLQGMIALAMHRLLETETATDIIKSLKENAIYSDEMGMYWKDMHYGYYWYQAPVETQALLIECFDEVANDQKSVEEMKVWLLKQKQTQDWKTTKATTEACFALLLRGTDWLARNPDISIMLGDMLVDPDKLPDAKVQAGTGYFRTSWFESAINASMGKVKISKKDEGVAWGALYWQYFEQLDKITPAETPLKINKKLFVERYSDHGPVIEPVSDKTTLKVGDKIKVRIEIRVDRDMEYVHMKDMRAAGFEPINVMSQYKYQGGLGYYESTGDVATNFFISWLPKGTYVFEYPLRVSLKGDFSNGITTIQCMYAPEFASHSEGIRVKVGG